MSPDLAGCTFKTRKPDVDISLQNKHRTENTEHDKAPATVAFPHELHTPELLYNSLGNTVQSHRLDTLRPRDNRSLPLSSSSFPASGELVSTRVAAVARRVPYITCRLVPSYLKYRARAIYLESCHLTEPTCMRRAAHLHHLHGFRQLRSGSSGWHLLLAICDSSIWFSVRR